jgi:hypothetical protein
MRTTATDRQKIKKLVANDTFKLLVKLYGMIGIVAIVLAAVLKMA